MTNRNESFYWNLEVAENRKAHKASFVWETNLNTVKTHNTVKKINKSFVETLKAYFRGE